MNDPEQHHPAYEKFAHHNWRFWVGLFLIIAAMFVYLMTEDLSWRPRQPPPSAPQAKGIGVDGK